MTLCRELTKIHEEIIRTTLEDAQTLYSDDRPPKGEFVIVVAPSDKEEAAEFWQNMSLEEHVEFYIFQGMSEKDAMKMAAKDRKIAKRDVYDAIKKH